MSDDWPRAVWAVAGHFPDLPATPPPRTTLHGCPYPRRNGECGRVVAEPSEQFCVYHRTKTQRLRSTE